MSREVHASIKNRWYVCMKHKRVLFERVHCPGKPSEIGARDVTGATCEAAGDFDSELAAHRWLNKLEIDEAGDDVP